MIENISISQIFYSIQWNCFVQIVSLQQGSLVWHLTKITASQCFSSFVFKLISLTRLNSYLHVEQHPWTSHKLSEVVNSTSTFFGDLGSIKFNMVGLSVYQSMTCLRSLRFVFQEYQHKLFLLFRFMHQSHLDQKWHFWKHFSFGFFFISFAYYAPLLAIAGIF